MASDPPLPTSHHPGDTPIKADHENILDNVNTQRTHSHIRAWEENEKAKSYNKYNRKLAKINAWENSKKASIEANLKKVEENLGKERASRVEKMNNKVAAVHKKAEEKRAMAEAKKGEELVKLDELASKYRSSRKAPKKCLCFGA